MESQITKDIKNTLKLMGMHPNWKGYKWWCTAVLYKLNNEECYMGELYSYVAKKHKTTASKAERALRYAVAQSKANDYFKLSFHLSNSIFLELMVEKIKDC